MFTSPIAIESTLRQWDSRRAIFKPVCRMYHHHLTLESGRTNTSVKGWGLFAFGKGKQVTVKHWQGHLSLQEDLARPLWDAVDIKTGECLETARPGVLEQWCIYQEVLEKGSKTNQRERHRNWKGRTSKFFDIRCGTTGVGVWSARFGYFFGQLFFSLCLPSSFLETNAYSVSLCVETHNVLFRLTEASK